MIERLTRNEAPSLLDTDKANELIDAINGLYNSTGAGGITVSQNGDGSLLIAPAKSIAGIIKYHPFEVISVNENEVVINAGLVNGVLPSNLSTNNGSGTSYMYLEVVGNDDGVSSVSLKRSTSPPDGLPWEENGVGTRFEYLIAIVTKTAVSAQVVNNNLNFAVSIAAEIPKTSVSIGEYPNDIYYSWRLTN
jgi:hypothetical protein